MLGENQRTLINSTSNTSHEFGGILPRFLLPYLHKELDNNRLNRLKTEGSHRDKIIRNTYPISGGIVSRLLSPTRMPKVEKTKCYRTGLTRNGQVHTRKFIINKNLPLTPTSHPLITCPVPVKPRENFKTNKRQVSVNYFARTK